MTAAAIALIAVFGSLGYLLVGLVTIAVGAAVLGDREISSEWWFALFLWPAIVPFGLVCGVGLGAAPAAKWFTLKVAKKLNPRVEEWENLL